MMVSAKSAEQSRGLGFWELPSFRLIGDQSLHLLSIPETWLPSHQEKPTFLELLRWLFPVLSFGATELRPGGNLPGPHFHFHAIFPSLLPHTSSHEPHATIRRFHPRFLFVEGHLLSLGSHPHSVERHTAPLPTMAALILGGFHVRLGDLSNALASPLHSFSSSGLTDHPTSAAHSHVHARDFVVVDTNNPTQPQCS